jgi:hypothetical protein
MCSHCDGSLSVWNLRATDKPVSINYPHSKRKSLILYFIHNKFDFSSSYFQR